MYHLSSELESVSEASEFGSRSSLRSGLGAKGRCGLDCDMVGDVFFTCVTKIIKTGNEMGITDFFVTDLFVYNTLSKSTSQLPGGAITTSASIPNGLSRSFFFMSSNKSHASEQDCSVAVHFNHQQARTDRRSGSWLAIMALEMGLGSME